jgi:hypothetical protein
MPDRPSSAPTSALANVTLLIPWAKATPTAGGIILDLDFLIAFARSNSLRAQAPEFRPSKLQLDIFAQLRGGATKSSKQLVNALGSSFYRRTRGKDELMELGLLDVVGTRYRLTEPGEAMASEWMDAEGG